MKNNKSLNDSIDDLLINLDLPSDKEIKDETNKLIFSKCGKRTINQNRTKYTCSKGGKVSGLNRLLTKTGVCGLSKEERQKNGLLGALAQSREDKARGGKIGGKLRKDKGKCVLMFDKITNKLIRKFTSVATASRFLNKRENKIRDVLHGRRKSSYGYIWKFEK